MKILLCSIAVFCGLYSFSQHTQDIIWHIADKKIDFTTLPATIYNLPLSEQSYSGDGVAISEEGKRLMYYSNSRKGIYFEDGSFLAGSENLHGVFVPNLYNRDEFFLFANNTVYRINLNTKSLNPLDYLFYDRYPSAFIVNEQCKKTWFTIFLADFTCQLYSIEKEGILNKTISLPSKYATTHHCLSPQSNMMGIVSNWPTLSVYLTRLNLEKESIEPLAQLQFANEAVLYQASFSPDQQKIYITALGKWNESTRTQQYKVIQLTIGEDFTMHSPVVIYQKELTSGIFPKMRLGSDGQIYISYTIKNRYIDIIPEPNLAGKACGFRENVITLNSFTYLPPAFVTWPSAVACAVSIKAVSGCALTPIQFSIENGQSIQSNLWNFGDGHTSTEAEPSHIYEKAGKYSVSLEILKSDNSTENISKEIEIMDKPLKPVIVKSSD